MSKYNYTLLLFIAFLLSCKNNIQNNGTGKRYAELENPIAFSMGLNNKLIQKDSSDLKYCLLENEKATVLGLNNIVTEPLEKIKVNVYGFDIGNLDTIQTNLNILLAKTFFGCSVDLNPVPVNANDLEKIETEGKLNTNNIKLDLEKNGSFDTSVYYHIYLFEESEFFNTANAITLKSDEYRIIMGDKDLLKTEMLLLHEMGHAFGLTHNNTDYENCDLYNVMHESNVGCSRIFTYRQSLMTTHKVWVETVDQDLGSVDRSNCECELATNSIILEHEAFVNSFDKNIDDTPAADNIVLLGNYYYDEILKQQPDPTTIDRLKANYQNEFDYYFGGTASPIDKISYVNKRITSHIKLRNNNLIRWLNNEREKTGLTILNVSEIYNMGANSPDLINYLDTTLLVRKADVLAQIEKHIPLVLDSFCDVNKPREDCVICKERNQWFSLDEVSKAPLNYLTQQTIVNAVDPILVRPSNERNRLIEKVTGKMSMDELTAILNRKKGGENQNNKSKKNNR